MYIYIYIYISIYTYYVSVNVNIYLYLSISIYIDIIYRYISPPQTHTYDVRRAFGILAPRMALQAHCKTTRLVTRLV